MTLAHLRFHFPVCVPDLIDVITHSVYSPNNILFVMMTHSTTKDRETDLMPIILSNIVNNSRVFLTVSADELHWLSQSYFHQLTPYFPPCSGLVCELKNVDT